jgi:hypothetical protein
MKGDDLRAKLPPQAILPSDYDTTLKFLDEYDKEERPHRAKWRCEILKVGITIPPVRVTPWERDHLVNLDEEIHRCWFEMGQAYTYGFFQSVTLMTCLIVELTLERYLRTKDLWDVYERRFEQNQRTFGTLVSYCRGSNREPPLLTSTILQKCQELNRMRIEAAHMNVRRNITLRIPPQTDPLNDMDEIEKVTVIERGEKTATMAIDEIGFLIDPQTSDFYKVRAFRRYAKESARLASEITKLLSQLY